MLIFLGHPHVAYNYIDVTHFFFDIAYHCFDVSIQLTSHNLKPIRSRPIFVKTYMITSYVP